MQPLQQVCNAHLKECSNTNSSRPSGLARSGAARGKKALAANKASAGSPSVTSVVFLDEYVLASAGATDGAVKLWDLRKSWNNEVSTPPLLPQNSVWRSGAGVRGVWSGGACVAGGATLAEAWRCCQGPLTEAVGWES